MAETRKPSSEPLGWRRRRVRVSIGHPAPFFPPRAAAKTRIQACRGHFPAFRLASPRTREPFRTPLSLLHASDNVKCTINACRTRLAKRVLLLSERVSLQLVPQVFPRARPFPILPTRIVVPRFRQTHPPSNIMKCRKIWFWGFWEKIFLPAETAPRRQIRERAARSEPKGKKQATSMPNLAVRDSEECPWSDWRIYTVEEVLTVT